MSTRMFTSPLFLGFDHLEQMLERASKTSSDGYPPYNIEQTGPTALRITLAVAGFTMDDLQLTQEDNQLVIRGRQTEADDGRVFLHRGIAARQFQRAFVLAEGIEVKSAWLDSGLLHIDLARPQPEVRIRTIKIGKSAQTVVGASGDVQSVERGGGSGNAAQMRSGAVRPVHSQPRVVDTIPSRDSGRAPSEN